MTAQVRLTVRIMDRTRSIDRFEMLTLAYDPGVLMLEAALAAGRLADGTPGCPDARTLSSVAAALVHDQALDDGFSVRTRLLRDDWLLYVRMDHRSGPAVVHGPRQVPLPLAA